MTQINIFKVKIHTILSIGMLNKNLIRMLPLVMVSLGINISNYLAIRYNYKARYKLKSSFSQLYKKKLSGATGFCLLVIKIFYITN